jgi:hypothetical protein
MHVAKVERAKVVKKVCDALEKNFGGYAAVCRAGC